MGEEDGVKCGRSVGVWVLRVVGERMKKRGRGGEIRAHDEKERERCVKVGE